MVEILLLIIACCLLFGAERTKAGIGFLLKVLAVIMIGFVILAFIGCNPDPAPEPAPEEESTVEQVSLNSYEETTVDELTDALEADVSTADVRYWNEYVSVTGRFDEINLIGELNDSFFYLSDINNDNDLKNITCYMKSDEQYQRIKQFSANEIITVKGKITDVSEFGYYLDVDSID